MGTNRLSFEVIGSRGRVVLDDYALVVAGYTGRDEAAVKEHIDELAAIGVPPPESVPAFYSLDSALLTQDPNITLAGGNTSGEVEPVLVRSGGRLYLAVGSDHTDRDVERDSVAVSKAICSKPVGRRLLELAAGFDWDTVSARSWVDGRLYQDGMLRILRVPTDVLDLYDDTFPGARDTVMFGGTVPVIGGNFVPGRMWEFSLGLPGLPSLELSYTVQPVSS